MFKLIKIELTKVFLAKSIWVGLLCCIVIITGLGALLSADDFFEESTDNQSALEQEYENTEDWKEKLRIQMQLNESMEDYYSQDEIELKNEILQFKIDKNLQPYGYNTTWDFISYTFQILNILLIIIGIWLTSEIVISEFTNKTYRLTYTKPYKRWQIYVSKYVAMLLTILFVAVVMLLISGVVGGLFFEFGGFASKTAICLFGKLMAITLGGEAFLYMFFAVIKAVSVASIVFLLAEICRNQVLTVIIGIACAMWGKLLFSKLVENGMTGFKYSLFMHYDFTNFIDSLIPYNFNALISGTVLAVHILLLLGAGILINQKRDL